MEAGTWLEIPTSTMDMYSREKVPLETVEEIEQFVAKYSSDEMWEFLFSWREFLEKQCSTKLPEDIPRQIALLKLWLEHTDADENMVDDFPDKVMLIHAGKAYVHAAHFFEENQKRRR